MYFSRQVKALKNSQKYVIPAALYTIILF